MSGTLYIVATPIGNLEDITLRALRTLKEVDVILAEDTRVTKKLLMHYDIVTHTLSYHQHSSHTKKLEILSRLQNGEELALVTDAGTPGVSDPGNELIDFLLKHEPSMTIVPIPGAAALTAALSVSGMNVNKFVFIGFLHKRKRKKLFGWIKDGKLSFAFYESPKRIIKTLDVIKEFFGEGTEVFIARELTKMHETLYRGSVGEVLVKLEKDTVKGEIVVVVSR